MEDYIMKTLRNLSAATFFLLLSGLVFARPSEVNIRLNTHLSFKLIIDQSIYNHATSYFIPNLHKGYHYVAAYEKRNLNGPDRLVYSGNVYIPESKKIDAVISKHNGFKIIRETIIHDNNHYGDNNGGNYYKDYGMGNNEFNQLKSTIRNKSFDSSKLDIAKSALTSNWVSSKQVLELLMLFSFESSKLDIAKFAFPKTIDKGNYFIVNNAFTFASSSNELNRFIHSGNF